MAVQIAGGCAVPSLFTAHTVAYIQLTFCRTFTFIGLHYTNTQGTVPYTTSRCLTDIATRFGAIFRECRHDCQLV